MAVKRLALVNVGNVALAAHPIHYLCDTTAELPTSGLKLGDTALTVDTNTQYKAASSTTWAVAGGGGGAGTPATTVTPDTTYGKSPVVGTDTNFAREGHDHGTVPHDSHTLLSGVTADQHHATVHGSAQHTGGIIAAQDEGTALGTIATVNFVGAGVTASIAGTVGTVTIPGGVAPSAFVIKTADESVVSSTVLQNDNHLFFSMAANEVWQVSATLLPDSASATPGIKLGITLPTGATARWSFAGQWEGNLPVAATTQAGTLATPLQASTANTTDPCMYRYLVINGSTAGNFQLTWAQNVSNATATFLRKYSNLAALRIA